MLKCDILMSITVPSRSQCKINDHLEFWLVKGLEKLCNLPALPLPPCVQVQYSLLDRRPRQSGLVSLCKEHNIQVIAYVVLAGGFLTDAWLGADAPPVEAY